MKAMYKYIPGTEHIPLTNASQRALAMRGNYSATYEQVKLTPNGLLLVNCYLRSSETWKSSELSLNYCYENKGGFMAEQNI